jgi:hypothetical protein
VPGILIQKALLFLGFGGKNPAWRGWGCVFIETVSDRRRKSKEKYVIADS